MLDKVADRFKEPSTYAGIAFLLGLAGVHLTPESWTGVVSLISAVGGVLAVVVPEKAA